MIVKILSCEFGAICHGIPELRLDLKLPQAIATKMIFELVCFCVRLCRSDSHFKMRVVCGWGMDSSNSI
jgi:hypothetical protein